MHTKDIAVNGVASRMFFNSDFSGTVEIKSPDFGSVEIPGAIVKAIREDALDEAREALAPLLAALGYGRRHE